MPSIITNSKLVLVHPKHGKHFLWYLTGSVVILLYLLPDFRGYDIIWSRGKPGLRQARKCHPATGPATILPASLERILNSAFSRNINTFLYHVNNGSNPFRWSNTIVRSIWNNVPACLRLSYYWHFGNSFLILHPSGQLLKYWLPFLFSSVTIHPSVK